MKQLLCIVLCCGMLFCDSHAADSPVTFDNADDRERYDLLLEELRCLVCQNQSLADSHADLAQDLRDEVYAMVIAGKDNRTIADFMVERYGDFVLYKPPMKSSTWLLWFGPLVLLFVAVITALKTTSKRASELHPLSDAERERVASLTDRDAE